MYTPRGEPITLIILETSNARHARSDNPPALAQLRQPAATACAPLLRSLLGRRGRSGEEVLGILQPPQPMARAGLALPDLDAEALRRRRGQDLVRVRVRVRI